MENEIKLLLEKNLEVSHESLRILKKLHHGFVLQRIFFFIKWLLIIALLWIGYVQARPYLDTLFEVYNNIQGILPGS